MSCSLIQNIKHTCEYNSGGISNIYLLDIRDFLYYVFQEDLNYDNCFVERIIKKDVPYIQLSNVNESNFTESNETGLYTQQLTTFVRTIKAPKTSSLVLSSTNKYLVVFENSQGYIYSFGSDGGASVSFTQVSGQLGEASGYNITITKDSIYPLFEVDKAQFNKTPVLGTENNRIVITEDRKFAILI